eukprot:TRINITY_DN5003_c0_g1_i1.p1 TRINITY_DN5003_c0_g1~~TRINITY_DN5003_c0_g1_i1.p1  ORF type:complete len:436 (+),score=81.80 TRINITY_DN5003_c0_g1_i1:77-1309(+)
MPPSIQDYELRELLGRGASGEVRRGRRGGRDYAVKTIRCKTADEANHCLQERIALAKITCTCDHIVRCEEVFLSEEHTTVYTVMPLYKRNIFDLLSAHHPMEEPEVLTMLADICAGLKHLHEKSNIPHGNLKQENILIGSPGTSEGEPCYAIADITGAEHSDKNLPLYIAPELVDKVNGESSFKSDMWPVGVIACLALFGRRLVETKMEDLRGGKGMRAHSELGQLLKQGVKSKLLRRIVKGLLHPYPEKRLGSAEVLTLLGDTACKRTPPSLASTPQEIEKPVPECCVCYQPAATKCDTCSKGSVLYFCEKDECFFAAHKYQKGHEKKAFLQCGVCGSSASHWCEICCGGGQAFYLCSEECFHLSHKYQKGHDLTEIHCEAGPPALLSEGDLDIEQVIQDHLCISKETA